MFDSYKAFMGEGFIGVTGKWKLGRVEVGFISIYGPHDLRKKSLLWDSVSRIICSLDIAWCIFGDFNKVRNAGEKENYPFVIKRCPTISIIY